MIGKRSLICLLAVAVLSLFLVACEEEDALTPATGGPTPTPDRQATITALAQATRGGTPTPTPVPAEERNVVLDFARSHAAISQDWERFHTEFDEWKESLVTCDASSIQVSLRQFAGRSRDITESARRLQRSPIVKGLADKVIEATEGEERALRLLRDNWQPGDTKVFEDVDSARSAAQALQKEAQDDLISLQKRTAASTRQSVEVYSLALLQLDTDWDKFHQDYDDFRAQEADLTPAQTVARLSQLIDQFTEIAAAVRALPASETTRPVSEVLAKAAEAEELSLRKLRGTFKKSESTPGEEATASEGSEATFTLLDPTLFDAFNAQLIESNGMRRQAGQGLADVLGITSEENQAAVEDFTGQYDLLLQGWGQFHKDYDAWRRADGGCDVPQAISTLGGFTLRFGELAGRVRDLPRDAFLRPLGELLVEAAEREEQALRDLRNGWRPFDADVYEVLDQERNISGKLRRQVASGILDLLARYK